MPAPDLKEAGKKNAVLPLAIAPLGLCVSGDLSSSSSMTGMQSKLLFGHST